MLLSLTGTPGTGKTSVSEVLKEKGFKIIDLNKFSKENNFIIGRDKKRESDIVDIDKINKYFLSFKSNDIVIVESHLSHLIKNSQKVIVLRCNPKKLRKNLEKKNWNRKKINENIQAEILDIILSETVENHNIENIIEIDITKLSINKVAEIIEKLIKDNFKNIKNYKIGKIDWSEDLFNDNIN